MDFSKFVRLLQRGWLLVVATLLAGGGIGYLSVIATTPEYQATTELYVTVSVGSTSMDILQGGTAAQEKVQSYVSVATSTRVLEPVIDELKLDTTPARLAAQVRASTPIQSVLIDVTVTDIDPTVSAKIANAIADNLSKVVSDDLENASGTDAVPVDMTVLTPATAPTSPSSPHPAVNIAAGLVLGGFVGFALIALRASLDTRLRDREDVSETISSPLLAQMSFDRSAAEHPLVVHDDPHAPRAEAFRRLRTNLQFLEMGKQGRSFVVTSSLPGEGKSTTASNLAITIAESGARVVLIDGDLRRPRVDKALGIEGAVGLTDVLVGQAELSDVLQPWGFGGLAILPAGNIPPNPTELLGSQAMALVLDELAGAFDYVIIDAPPLLPVTDATILAKVTSGALLVVAMGRTTRKQLETARASLDAANAACLGVVINKARQTGSDRYSSNYSSHAANTRRTTRRPFARR